jgi:hypothetical protein
LLIPLSIAIGLLVGINATYHYMQLRIADTWSSQAYINANISALLQDGQIAAARQEARNEMLVYATSFANVATKEDTRRNDGVMRQISTFVTCTSDRPSAELSTTFLTTYPPYNRANAQQIHCDSGICTYTKQHAPIAQ